MQEYNDLLKKYFQNTQSVLVILIYLITSSMRTKYKGEIIVYQNTKP
ncbi:hypothetical protein HNQ74_000482 [Bartonella doshiae]|uniref:Uncharacterized protein n=1 Tax=Bartonella doshiae NCTC 12862 = ATCC 700133 TaxID=1094553 RepID=A0ABN0GHX4_BARDO|nr:hypothetical protein MCS_00499 [Bartonella doshiae NCTC 12862 = ATCC 700133]MBB6159069.1 hypothetical protein [Bartonella doshiae]